MKIIRIILISFSFLFVTTLHSVYGADTATTINLEPKYPNPKSNVTLTLESYSFDVDTAFITWKIDNKIVLEGEGEKKLTLKTGDVGSATVVNMTAKSADGSSVEQKLSITPSSIVLLYESPTSHVPHFYQGRSLPADGALVRLTAISQISDNGVLVSPSSLAYAWYINGSVLQSVSGKGKQAATIRLDYLRESTEVEVFVRSPLGNSSRKTITITPHQILPRLYLYDPVFGSNYNQSIKDRYETTQNFSLSFEPYYVSEEESTANISWFIDGIPSTPINGQVLGFQPKENSYGLKKLNIIVKSSDQILQKAEESLELIFDTRK